MGSLISESSIQAVKDAAKIETVAASYVTLKRAGGGNLKGLCPFHDEKTPSFNVNTSKQHFHCFGCGEGGDVIVFLQRMENLSFVETIETLAELTGVTLERSASNEASEGPTRSRLAAANAAAAAFFAHHLTTPAAHEARAFFTGRGFDRDLVETFGCGYAPGEWTALSTHLRGHGFTDAEIVAAGLATRNSNGGLADRFRNRIIWPIYDAHNTILGFGGRRLDEADPAKYINTSETTLYRKSRVLFGLNHARRHLSRQREATVVEGYTDVMACHAAGIATAVATCGTAFSEGHIHVLRRLIADNERGASILYMFDGDAAGREAALRAFEHDDHFQSRTFVYADPDGMDPCDVRLRKGDLALREAAANDRVPLFEFVLRSRIAEHDATTPDGRINAITSVIPVLSKIREPQRSDYMHKVALWVGSNRDHISSLYRATTSSASRASSNPSSAPAPRAPAPTDPTAPTADPAGPPPPPRSPAPTTEHLLLRCVVQDPTRARAAVEAGITREDFSHPGWACVWDSVQSIALAPVAETEWIARLIAATPWETTKQVISSLAVEESPQTDVTAQGALAYALLAEASRARAHRISASIPESADEDTRAALRDEARRLLDRSTAAAASARGLR